MQRSFLQSYLDAFHRIEGWFTYDAALLFMAYNQLISDAGISGDTLEIGVYFGLSAIAAASLRGSGRRFYAIDLFENLQSCPGYGSGSFYRPIFEENMKSMFGTVDFMVPVSGASGQLKSSDYTQTFSFCHVDGGHSPEETYDDLKFSSDILVPGGLLSLDDYFNHQEPGVGEGAIEFGRTNPGVLSPVAIGYNKVIFQKLPAPFDLNARFLTAFPEVRHLICKMWKTPVLLFGEPLRAYFDLYASTPSRLVALGAAGARATFTPDRQSLKARPAAKISLPVIVKNTSNEPFPCGAGVFGLSYHLLSATGQTIQHDNERTYLHESPQPGEQTKVNLRVTAPKASGDYKLEIDFVWEGVMWFKDVANPTCIVDLSVR